MSTDRDLTDDDINTLVEALEAWESKDFGLEVLTDVFGMAISKDKSQFEEFQLERDHERAKQKAAKAVRKERSIILRAKLLTIRNARGVDRLEAEVSGKDRR
jgi:hypothetical protein